MYFLESSLQKVRQEVGGKMASNLSFIITVGLLLIEELRGQAVSVIQYSVVPAQI